MIKFLYIILLVPNILIANLNVNNENEIKYFDDDVNGELGDSASEENINSLPPFPGPAPINDYLPLLAVAAVGLGFYYRKELNQITK